MEWWVMHLIETLKELIVRDVITLGGIIFGSYPVHLLRKNINYIKLSKEDMASVKPKYYDKDVVPDTWYWREPFICSDIDCIIPSDKWDSYLSIRKKYWLDEPTLIPTRYVEADYSMERYRVFASSIVGPTVRMDIFVIHPDNITNYLRKLEVNADVNINRVMIFKKPYTTECDLLSVDAMPGADIESIRSYIENNTVKITNFETNNMYNRLFKTLYRHYKIKITKAISMLYFKFTDKSDVCTICGLECEISTVHIYTNERYFHAKCYHKHAIAVTEKLHKIKMSEDMMTYTFTASDTSLTREIITTVQNMDAVLKKINQMPMDQQNDLHCSFISLKKFSKFLKFMNIINNRQHYY
jgi:hypothetical protein